MGWAVHQLYQTRWDALAVAAMIGSVCVSLVVADFQVWLVEQTTGTRPLGILMLARGVWRLLGHWMTARVAWSLLSILFSLGLFYSAWLCGRATGQRAARLRHARAAAPRLRPPTPPLARPEDSQEESSDESNNGEQPRWQLMAMGVGTHHFSLAHGAHTMAGRQTCCICDLVKDRTMRCNNIADYVCITCVITWAVNNAGRASNNWPCCRD